MIRIPKVRVVAEDGEQLGIMLTEMALKRAMDAGLDLVEVASTANPPVCKIMDYGKFKYQQQKKKQESKKHQVVTVVKEIKLRPNTDDHDLDFKMKHAKRFIEEKDKVKITMQFRGREMMFLDRGKETLNKIVTDFDEIAEVEMPPQKEGRTLSVILAPRTSKKKFESKMEMPKPAVAAPAAPSGPQVSVVRISSPVVTASPSKESDTPEKGPAS